MSGFVERCSHHGVLPLLFLFSGVLHSAGIYAAEYALGSSVAANAEYRERSSGGDKNEWAEYNLFPSLKFSREQEDSTMEANLGAHFRRYSDGIFDSNDFDASLAYRRQFERSSYVINAFARRESTLIEQETIGGSGPNFGTSRDVDSFGASLLYSYQLTEKQLARFSVGVTKRDYEKGDNSDSLSYNAGINYSFRLAPRMSWILTIRANDFSSDDAVLVFNDDELIASAYSTLQGESQELIDNYAPGYALNLLQACFGEFDREVDANDYSFFFVNDVAPVSCYTNVESENNTAFYQALTGFNYLITENLSLELQAGIEHVVQELTQEISSDFYQDVYVDNTRNSETYEASLSYQEQETTSYSLTATRRSAALNTGSVETRDNVGFILNHKFSTRDSVSMSLQWYDESTVSGGISFAARERYMGSLEYKRGLSENWHAGIRYRYFDEKYNNLLNIDQHSVMLTLNWSPQPHKWRR